MKYAQESTTYTTRSSGDLAALWQPGMDDCGAGRALPRIAANDLQSHQPGAGARVRAA